MLKLNISKLAAGAAALLAVAAAGCTDKWDDHYSPAREGASESTVYELIKSEPELSTFAQMIDIAGYADLLNTSQTFTVWAPDNASLADVDLDDTDEVKRIVANHICRFNVSTASPAEKGVKMYNGKMLYFAGNTFGGITMTRSDILARNGILHTLSGRLPYSYNIREYIDTHESTSKLAAFLKRFDEERFDETLSAPIDIDENGATVYDSVKVSYNRIFQHPVYGLGDIQCEDSLFTMIVPDNAAWDAAYAQISPLFRNAETDSEKSDSITDVQTSLTIIENLIFRSRITDPLAAPTNLTTSGSKIADMGSFFSGASSMVASNGMIYNTSLINYDPLSTFNKPIEVECEEPSGRVKAANTNIYARTVATDHELASDISEGSFIEVSPTTASAQPGVTFDMPGTLAGKYDIYATFVPASALDATVTGDCTRVMFILSYQGADGRTLSKTFNAKEFLTDPTQVTTIKVAEGVELDVANYTDRLWLMDDANDPSTVASTTRLAVRTNVTNKEFKDLVYTRHFYIDRVVLVSSQQ